MIASIPRIVGGLLALALFAWWWHRKNRVDAHPVPASENPDLWDAMTEHFEELDRELEQARHWSKGEVALAIEHYVFKLEHSSEDEDGLLQKLALQPAKTQRQVLKVLTDPNMQTRLRKEPRGEPALYRACQALLVQPTHEAVPYLRKLLTAEQDAVRIDVFQWLAQTSDASAIDELVNGLGDSDPRVPAAIVTGLGHGCYPADSPIAHSLFGPLESLVVNPPHQMAEAATKILWQWDRAQLLTDFEQQGLLDPGHGAFADVITAMQECGEFLPRERLLEMLDHADLALISERDATALLRMLAHFKHHDDRSMLLECMEQPGPVAAAAATALLAMHDLDGWVAAILDESRRERSEPEQRAYAVWMLDCDLHNGGFQHYFSNPGCAHWQSALAGLRDAGDDERAELLQEALQCLPQAPPSEAAAQERQLTRLEPGSRAAFAELDDRYYALTRPIQVSLTRIILTNADAFRS